MNSTAARRRCPIGAKVAIGHHGAPAGRPDEAALLRESIHFFFAGQADSARRRLRKLFRDGRVSLAIGLVVLAGTIALASS